MGAALRPRIPDKGWAASEAQKSEEEEGRVQRLSQTSRSAGGRGRWRGGSVPNPSHLLFVCPESGRK